MRLCQNCKKPVPEDAKNKKYCSDKCSREYRTAHAEKAAMPKCMRPGCDNNVQSRSAKYCSFECHIAHRRVLKPPKKCAEDGCNEIPINGNTYCEKHKKPRNKLSDLTKRIGVMSKERGMSDAEISRETGVNPGMIRKRLDSYNSAIGGENRPKREKEISLPIRINLTEQDEEDAKLFEAELRKLKR